MCGAPKFFICKHCGNMAVLVDDKGKPLICCGVNMTEITSNTVEASVEKHLPAVSVSGDNISVQVGSTLHPMEKEHYIAFAYVQTENGGQCKCLKVGEEPKATFSFVGDKPAAVYAYCNLHGMWKTEIA